ncbi:N-acetylmuramoyl-L-alanine amidase [Streptomyces sp. NPDC001910]|uniref:peptidoglycan recognition protein family protein n=1 Tax=Streptomyces sp. NPDC001910 TaxID=3154403 RepID=UPI003328F1E9
MTATQVVAQLKKWGLKYVEIPGWATHNRNSRGAWGPVNGFIWHHTGADVSNTSAKSYAGSTLYNGLSDLPGPLCHFSIGADGTVYLVGWGRANHAGGGDPATLQHVIDEDYTGQLHPTRGNSNGVDGNAHFYGVEIQYSGGHEMSPAQYAAARRLSAALLDFHGWTERSVIAHGEWSSDKWDPGYAPGKIMAMPGVRADVKATLAAGPNQEDDVALTTDDINKVAAAVYTKLLKTDDVLAAPADASDYATNKSWTWQTHIQDVTTRVRDLGKKVDGLSTPVVTDSQVATLAAAVAANPVLAERIAELVASKLAARLAQ